jgi:cob(I)alamin adenosyltransferase
MPLAIMCYPDLNQAALFRIGDRLSSVSGRVASTASDHYIARETSTATKGTLMTIYTRTGDGGETGLFGGPRVGKDVPRIEACGTLDELNAVLGLVRAEPLPEAVDRLLQRLQNELFEVGAELATPDPVVHGHRTIGPGHVGAMEADIDRHEQSLPPLKEFVLPSGTRAAAGLHLARAVCRRAERRVVALIRQRDEEISPVLPAYLNRLGDLLFVLARAVNAEAGRPDVPWQKPL